MGTSILDEGRPGTNLPHVYGLLDAGLVIRGGSRAQRDVPTVGEKRDLGDLSSQHLAHLNEQCHQGSLEVVGFVDDSARLVDEVQTVVLGAHRGKTSVAQEQ